MTISTFSIELPTVFGALGTRSAGAKARHALIAALQDHENVTLDFQWQNFTPSFADECVGQLAAELGPSDFRQRVKIINVLDELRPLLRHVVARRTLVAA